ncbi:hypothetical protein EDD21DRAFT_428721 [Dissophora ornata]|nr:hypothetical protein EDD21DRAFT_428721 [Dissophora ornata]
MGFPIELPSSRPGFVPDHSAKPSWSNSTSSVSQHHLHPFSYNVSALLLTSSSLTSALSLSRQPQPLLESHPPLSTFAYVPLPPSIWGASMTNLGGSMSSPPPQLVQSPLPISTPTSPSTANYLYSAGLGTWTQESNTEREVDLVYSGVTTASTTVDIETREMQTALRAGAVVRAHPSLRRISRVPAFITVASTDVLNISRALLPSGSAAAAVAAITGTGSAPETAYSPQPASSSNTRSSATSSSSTAARAGVNAIWYPASPSHASYLTRPLPPPPATAVSSQSTSISSTSPPSFLRGPQQLQQQADGPQTQQPQSDWNRRFINPNHVDNRGRVDVLGRIGYGLNGYYYDNQHIYLEQQQQNEQYHQVANAPRYEQRRAPLYRHPPYDALTGPVVALTTSPRRDEMTAGDPEAMHWMNRTQQAMEIHRHLSQSSQSSSSPPPSSPSELPSFLQGLPATARTVIRAHSVHQGVIHIYSEDHAPIVMYGRPILSSSSSPSSSCPSCASIDIGRNFANRKQ